jgi:hypothetical protein
MGPIEKVFGLEAGIEGERGEVRARRVALDRPGDRADALVDLRAIHGQPAQLAQHLDKDHQFLSG